MSDQPSDRHPVLFAIAGGGVIGCTGLTLWFHSVWWALAGGTIFLATALIAMILDTIGNRN